MNWVPDALSWVCLDWNTAMLNHEPQPSRRKRPWRNALIATTWLSVMFVLATLVWNSGHAQWAFLLGFVAVWLLLSVSWSNVHFTEESSSILAKIVDQNFTQMHERVERLERELARFQNHLSLNHEPAGSGGKAGNLIGS